MSSSNTIDTTQHEKGFYDRYVSKIFSVLSLICFSVMVGLVFYNAVLRYFFHSSLPITEEVARFTFMYITFLGGVIAFIERRHISVNIFTNFLSAPKAKMVRFFGGYLSVIMLILLFFGSVEYVSLTQNRITTATRIHYTWITSLVLVVSIGGLFAYFKNTISEYFKLSGAEKKLYSMITVIVTAILFILLAINNFDVEQMLSVFVEGDNSWELMPVVIFFVALFSLLVLEIPIVLVLLITSLILMVYLDEYDLSTISLKMMQGTNSFPLMAIPFFVFAGEIMSKGGLSQRIVQFADLLVGRVRGGLGYVAIVACILFAGLMGSSVGAAAAIGSILLPLMHKAGYEKGRAGGVIAAGAILGPIIPPSTNMIILATAVSGLSITKLFMIGLVPGVLIGLFLIIVWWFVVRKDNYNDITTYSKDQVGGILIDTIPAFLMPILLLGGIRMGIFTPTEGGAFAAVYALVITAFYYKELKLKNFIDVCVGSVKTTAIVMMIVASASAVGHFITLANIPDLVGGVFRGLIDKPLLLLFIINLFLLVVGMVMDLTPNILIFAPVFFPIIKEAGIDIHYFGLLFVYNLCIGVITPPIGTVLYVISGIGDTPLGKVVKGLFPFLMIQIFVLILLILFPSLSLVPLNFLM